MLDASRLARDQYAAIVFKHEYRKRGLDVTFATMPELDGVSAIIMPAVLHAMDEVHSYLSKVKVLAGMAENVRHGFRAGGRALFGYRLEDTHTGAIREGEQVTKSRLVTDDSAPNRHLPKGPRQGINRHAFCRKIRAGSRPHQPQRHRMERPHLCLAYRVECPQRKDR